MGCTSTKTAQAPVPPPQAIIGSHANTKNQQLKDERSSREQQKQKSMRAEGGGEARELSPKGAAGVNAATATGGAGSGSIQTHTSGGAAGGSGGGGGSTTNPNYLTTLGDALVSGMEIRRVLAPIENIDSILETKNTAATAPAADPASTTSYEGKHAILYTSRLRFNKSSQFHATYAITQSIIGSGVSGEVKVAVHKFTKEEFALKILSLENKGSSNKAAIIHNEVEIYLRLDHPNIARLVEVYEDDKRIYLLMEYCKGRELYERLAIKKRYTEAEAISATKQMLEAILYCHRKRICHRDLKLENWVYADPSPNARLKLIDFGFSRFFNPAVPMTAMHGTVYYVSPEVMDGCYREKCDLWSVGVITYMLLSGSPPFNGTMDYQILAKVRQAQYEFDSPVWQKVSPNAKSFISSLLCKDSAQRLSAEQALQHPWITGTSSSPTATELTTSTAGNIMPRQQLFSSFMIQVLQKLRSFARLPPIKRVTIAAIAFKLNDVITPNDIMACSNQPIDLYDAFRTMSAKSNGCGIKVEDFVHEMKEHLRVKEEEARAVFRTLNFRGGDPEGMISYSSFVAGVRGHDVLMAAASVEEQSGTPRQVAAASLVTEAFRILDQDEDGVITWKDLQLAFGTQTAEEIFASASKFFTPTDKLQAASQTPADTPAQPPAASAANGATNPPSDFDPKAISYTLQSFKDRVTVRRQDVSAGGTPQAHVLAAAAPTDAKRA